MCVWQPVWIVTAQLYLLLRKEHIAVIHLDMSHLVMFDLTKQKGKQVLLRRKCLRLMTPSTSCVCGAVVMCQPAFRGGEGRSSAEGLQDVAQPYQDVRA